MCAYGKELPLRLRGERRLRRFPGETVDAERELAEDVAHARGVRRQNLVDDARHLPARRALKIAELDERHLRSARAGGPRALDDNALARPRWNLEQQAHG